MKPENDGNTAQRASEDTLPPYTRVAKSSKLPFGDRVLARLGLQRIRVVQPSVKKEHKAQEDQEEEKEQEEQEEQEGQEDQEDQQEQEEQREQQGNELGDSSGHVSKPVAERFTGRVTKQCIRCDKLFK